MKTVNILHCIGATYYINSHRVKLRPEVDTQLVACYIAQGRKKKKAYLEVDWFPSFEPRRENTMFYISC